MGGGSLEQWGVRFYIGEIKNLGFFKLENFQKIIKKINEKLEFFGKLLMKFYDFLKNFIEFSRKFSEKLRKLWKYRFVVGSGGRAPEASENI